MNFVYDEDNNTGTFRIKEIKYTGNTNANLQPDNAVHFYYTTRNDPQTAYIAGAKSNLNELLYKIQTFNSGQLVKKYILNYADVFYSHLVEVIEYGSDYTKFNSTAFSYGDNPVSFETSTSNITEGQTVDIFTGDYDGDGYSDIMAATYDYIAYFKYHTDFKIYKHSAASNQYSQVYSASLPASYSIIQATKVSHNNFNFLSSDFDGDGREDIAIVNTTQEQIDSDRYLEFIRIYHNQSGNNFFYFDYYPPGKNTENQSEPLFNVIHPNGRFYFPGDFDGNGKTDYIVFLKSIDSGYKAFLTNPISFSNKEVDGLGDYYSSSTIPWRFIHEILILDYDGDGKDELMMIYNNATTNILSINKKSDGGYEADLLAQIAYPTIPQKIFTGDFNGDGKTDLLTQFFSSWGVHLSSEIAYSTGNISSTGSFFNIHPFSFNNTVNGDGKILIADFNGDGKSDILHGFNYYQAGGTFASKLDIYYSKSTSFVYEQNNFDNILGYMPTLADLNGDGRKEIINKPNNNYPFDILYFKPNGIEHLLKKSINGLGLNTEFFYKRLTEETPFYTKGTNNFSGLGGDYPINHIQYPLYMVSSYQTENGIGSNNTITFSYTDAKIHKLGKGFLGFSSIASTNNATGITTTHFFEANQSYFNVSLLKTESKLNSGSMYSKTEYTNNTHHFANGRIFPFVSKEIKTDYFSLTGSGNITVVTTTDYEYYQDANRNLKQVKVDQGGEATTISLFENYSNSGSWCPSEPGKVTTTQTRTGSAAYQRIINYIYNSNGTIQIIENDPGKTLLVKTEYSNYDVFGNPRTIIVSAPGQSSLSSRISTLTYDNRGRFQIISSNSLNHTLKKSYDYFTGSVLTETDANGLAAKYSYDGFGRLVKTISPAGLETTSQFNWNTTSGPSGAVWQMFTTTSGTAFSKVWFDILGRPIKNETEGFDGSIVFNETSYNNKGQVISQTRPKKSSETDYITTYIYDDIGRLTQSTSPVVTMQYEYEGLKTTERNASTNQYVHKTLDATGRLAQVEDIAGKINYTYSSSGSPFNIKFTPVTGSTVQSSFQYDEYGRQIILDDPDAGTINYEYNAFGELTKQTDQKGNETKIHYDQLGRIIKKEFKNVSNQLTTHIFEYDGNSKKGFLTKEEAAGATVTYSYDNLSRLIKAVKAIGSETFEKKYAYDQQYRITNETYPSGFSVNYIYNNYGYLNVIESGDENLWEGTTMNSQGQFLQWKIGKNSSVLHEENTYNNNGFLTEQTIVKGQSNNGTVLLQNIYTWQENTGNLSDRTQFYLQEEFQYDDLNRLTSIGNNTVPALNKSFTYDNHGNLLTKPDAGLIFKYSDGNGGPHALSAIISPTGQMPSVTQKITYTPFNSVEKIEEPTGQYALQFIYGPNEHRSKMEYYENNTLQNTLYYFGNYEKKINAAPAFSTEWHYITAPTGLAAIYIITTDQAIDMKPSTSAMDREGIFYIAQDHLGSIIALIDEDGNKMEEFSYDAWGRKRNASDWTDHNVTASQYIHRGYTGHEHLDQFNLINMNGRLYDPLVGRMLSPDNFVQDVTNTQGYNRYSYVVNNPLKYTDPTGEVFVVDDIIMAAVIGGMINVAIQGSSGNANSLGDLGIAFGIGALAGAGGAFVGGAVAGAIGFGGFAGGAVVGASAGFTGGFIGGSGNAWMNGSNFGDGLMVGVKGGAFGAVTGGLIGGTVAGIDAVKSGGNFWNGKVYESGGDFGSNATFLNEEIPAGGKPTATGEIATRAENPHYGKYGMTRDGGSRGHFGVDYAGNEGDAVSAMYDGKVTQVGGSNAYGPNFVRTSSTINGKTYNVDYGHMSKSVVTLNKAVSTGDMVGYMGRMGIPNGMPTHVHIAVWRPVNGLQGFVMPWWK